MTQRREDTFTTLLNNNGVPSSCWWSDEVLSAADPNSSTLYRDFVLISEFSELEGPLPLAVVAKSSYIDLKHYTDLSRHKQEEEEGSSPDFARSSLEQELKKIGLEYFDFNAFVLRVVSVDRSSEYGQMDEGPIEPVTPSSLFADESTTPPCLFSIPDDTQVYFTDSEHKFFAFTHHLTLFDINARGYVHPVALSYITRDPDKIMIRFEELMERFNEVSVKMKKGNFSNFTLDLKCRLLDLEYTESNVSTQQKPALSIQAIKQAITATKLMIDTLESSISQMNTTSRTPTTSSSIDIITETAVAVGTANDSITKETISSNSSTRSPSPTTEKKEYTVDPPKDYKPKCIDSLYPVPHFERKLRSLAQLCQEPDETAEEQQPTAEHHHMKKPSLTQKTAALIPLVFSIIEPQAQAQQQQQQENESTHNNSNSISGRPTLAHAIKYDMYSEAIKSIQDMTHYLGKSSVILDVNEEERLFIDPIASALTFGRTFMLNMDNPQPREEEKDTATDTENVYSIPSNTILSSDEKTDSVRKEEPRENKKEKEEIANQQNSSSAQETNDDSYYAISLAPAQLWKSSSQETPSHLLEVLKRYQSLVVDVIFSLLTGRTVLIQGSNKEKVQQVVGALSVFVPGQSRHRHQIIDWFDSTGRLTGIGGIKLVGIDKEKMDSSIHMEGSCVLDIDVKNGSLQSSPVYVEGQWINQLLDRMMLFSSDESYLAYLHTVFMTMSLKAFVYHHLYVCDEFKLLNEETPSSASSVNKEKGYISETNSESSTLSRKWSVRLLNYLKKHEDQENEVVLSRPPSRASSVASSFSHSRPQQKPQQQQEQQQQTATESSTTEDDQDYSEDNQATVTLQMIQQKAKQQERPRTIVGLFGSTTSSVAGEPVTTTLNATGCCHTDIAGERRESISKFLTASRKNSTDSGDSHSPRHLSDDEEEYQRAPLTMEGSLMNFGPEDLDYFGQQHSGNNSSSSSEEEEEEAEKSSHHGGGRHHRRRKLSDIGPDGISYTERRGRRYLQEKLKVYGDDQTIIVYLATCVL